MPIQGAQNRAAAEDSSDWRGDYAQEEKKIEKGKERGEG